LKSATSAARIDFSPLERTMTRIHTAAIALIALAAAPAYAAKPQIQWDEAYDFSTIKTFQWDPNPDSSLEKSNPFMHSRVMTAIEYELAASGLTKVETNPDIFVTYHTSTEKQVRLESDSYGYGFGGCGGAGWGHYGYGYAGPVSTTTRVVGTTKDARRRHLGCLDQNAHLARTATRVLREREKAESHGENHQRHGRAGKNLRAKAASRSYRCASVHGTDCAGPGSLDGVVGFRGALG
jgi:hypothetical protein